jgi:TPR repeat protein
LFYQLGGLFAHDGEPRYALAAYRLAAAQGDLRGTQQAAIIEFQGPPEVRDEASSLRDFRRAADLGDGESMLYVVAGLYVAGRGKAADPTLAEQYLAKAAATDDIAGVPDVTMREPSGGEITVATTGDATMVLIEVLERKNAGADSRTRESIVSLFAPPDASTAAGNAPAHGPLTERIESADGVTTDVHFDVAGRIASMQSVSSIVAALGPRPPDIANRLGDLFYGENDDIALAEYTQAADQGDPQGEANLGKMYLLGRAVPEDDQRALTLFHQADDRGNTDGATGLALMYAQARGVPKDCGRARDYFVRAHMRGPGLTTMLARFDCK